MNRLRPITVLSVAAVLAIGAAFFQVNHLQAQETAAIAQSAPAWKLKDLDGQEVSSEQFKGKVLVVDFWATWCGPCVAEIPGYIELQKKYGPAGLVIVGVSLDRQGPAPVKKFAQAQGMNYTLVMGNDEIVEAFGGFEAIPTTFLINRGGRIVNQKTGAMPAEAYEKLVKQALQ
jgi:thiol-disulfide isomerase/thioredoxin